MTRRFPIRFCLVFLSSLVVLASGCSKNIPVTTSPAANVPSAAIPTAYAIPLQVGSRNLRVEVAATETARQQGLSDRPPLTDDQGMLFDFHNLSCCTSGILDERHALRSGFYLD